MAPPSASEPVPHEHVGGMAVVPEESERGPSTAAQNTVSSPPYARCVMLRYSLNLRWPLTWHRPVASGDRHQARQPVRPSVRFTAFEGGDDEDDEQHEQPSEVDEREFQERHMGGGGGHPGRGHISTIPTRPDLADQLRRPSSPWAPFTTRSQSSKADRATVVMSASHSSRSGGCPQRGRHHGRDRIQQSAHGGRAGLGQVRARTVFADLLAELDPLQPRDQRRPEHEAHQERGDGGVGGAKRDVAEHVRDRARWSCSG